jgi:hypothetical protein
MECSQEFLDFLKSITAKRPRTVIEHILEYGFITSEELKHIYGYDHPPRAVRDVREHGVPIVTYRVTGGNGRSVAAYKFGNPNDVSNRGQIMPKMLSKRQSMIFLYLVMSR